MKLDMENGNRNWKRKYKCANHWCAVLRHAQGTVHFDWVRKFHSGTGYAYGAGYRCTEWKAPIIHHVLGGQLLCSLHKLYSYLGLIQQTEQAAYRRGVSNAHN